MLTPIMLVREERTIALELIRQQDALPIGDCAGRAHLDVLISALIEAPALAESLAAGAGSAAGPVQDRSADRG